MLNQWDPQFKLKNKNTIETCAYIWMHSADNSIWCATRTQEMRECKKINHKKELRVRAREHRSHLNDSVGSRSATCWFYCRQTRDVVPHRWSEDGNDLSVYLNFCIICRWCAMDKIVANQWRRKKLIKIADGTMRCSMLIHTQFYVRIRRFHGGTFKCIFTPSSFAASNARLTLISSKHEIRVHITSTYYY